MQTPNDEAYRLRLLKRLAVVADEGRPEFVRLAAIRSIQKMLPSINPLCNRSADELLEAVLPVWGNRLYLIGGRGQLRTVSRPPRSLRDVWS